MIARCADAARAYGSGIVEISKNLTVAGERAACGHRGRRPQRTVQLQRAALNARLPAVSLVSGYHQRAGANLHQVAAAADRVVNGVHIAATELQNAVVVDRAGDAAVGAIVAELQRAICDVGTASPAVIRSKYRGAAAVLRKGTFARNHTRQQRSIGTVDQQCAAGRKLHIGMQVTRATAVANL